MDFGVQNNNTMNLGNLNQSIPNSIPVVNPIAAPVQEPVMVQPQVIAPVQEPVATAITTNTVVEQAPIAAPVQEPVATINSPVQTPVPTTEVKETTDEVAQPELTGAELARQYVKEFDRSGAKVEVLKEYLHNILNTIKGRQGVGTAGLVQFKFEYESLTLLASDGSYHIAQKDCTSKYINIDSWGTTQETANYPQTFGIEVEALTALIDKLNCECVTFTTGKFDGNNKIIVLTDDGGSFIFDEKCDLDGSSLQIDLPQELFNAPAKGIDNPSNFRSTMNMSFSVVKDLLASNHLKGVRIHSGKSMCTDGGSMIMATLPAEFNNMDVFLSAEAVEAISKVKFGSYLEIGVCANPIQNASISKCVVLRGAYVFVMLPCKEDLLAESYPTSSLLALANTIPVTRVKLDPKELYNKIDTVCIFNQMGLKPRDVVRFDFANNVIKLSSFYNAGKTQLNIKEGMANFQNIYFDKKALLNIIQKANNGDIEIGIDTTSGTKFRIAYDDIIACLASVEGMQQ